MPSATSRERVIYSASKVTLSLTSFAAACAAVMAWLAPVHHLLDLIIAPVMCVVFLGLLVILLRRPHRSGTIMRYAMLAALAALVVPAWFYPLQATLIPGMRLIDSYPPVASLLPVLMMLAMIYLPHRQAVTVVLLGWLLVALPVLLYLIAHPDEMRTPRGVDLLMPYGPVFILFVVLIPVQRGLNSRIKRFVSEQAQMEAMVNRDTLTDIYNRRFSELFLKDTLSPQIPAGVILFDMDRFKNINDTCGHPVGDRVLQQVAKCCQHLLRKDECLARWGGDEFLIALPGVDRISLQALAERLRKSIAELLIEPGLQISASVGITLLQDGDTLPGLLKRADQALYRAKKQGGNAWLGDASLRALSNGGSQLEHNQVSSLSHLKPSPQRAAALHTAHFGELTGHSAHAGQVSARRRALSSPHPQM